MKLRFLYRAWKARTRDQQLEIAVAQALVSPGDCVLDAGANKGAYLYWLRKFAGETGSVLAYEPQPGLAAYLRQISSSFKWKNVEINSVALSNRAGKGMLHVPGSGVSPGASLESSVLANVDGSRFECFTDTLDHQLGQRAQVRFLKVDVEGHELALFQGAGETLRRHHPSLLFECEARHLSQHSIQDVFDFLQKLDYTGYLLQAGKLLPVARFNPEIHQAQTGPRFWDAPNYYNNFLFTARPLAPSLASHLDP